MLCSECKTQPVLFNNKLAGDTKKFMLRLNKYLVELYTEGCQFYCWPTYNSAIQNGQLVTEWNWKCILELIANYYSCLYQMIAKPDLFSYCRLKSLFISKNLLQFYFWLDQGSLVDFLDGEEF